MPPTSRPPCPVCHATRFRKRDGVLYCERGHQIQGYFDAEGDDVDLSRAIGRRLYIRKGNRTSKGANKSKLGVVYGVEGQYLAYEALQCIVAMQCEAIRERFGLGDEFQTLCRDLWLLFIQSHRLQAADPVAPPTSAPTVSQTSRSIHDMIYGAADRSDLQLSDDDEDDEDDDNDGGEEDSGSRHASNKRIRASIKYESGVDAEEHSESEPRMTAKRKTTRETLSTDFISLPLAPCILYIACLHLRIPIMLADIHRLCASNEIPYLTAYDTLPKYLQHALMNPFHHALQPWYLPSTTRLRTITADLAHIYLTKYSLPTPPPPISPLFLRIAVEWHLGPSFALSALALIASLKTQFDPAHFLSWAHAQIPTRDPRPGDLRVSLTDPELVLVAVAAKCAMLMLTPASAPSAAIARKRPGVATADHVYAVSKHDPPVSFQGLLRWASNNAREFATFARENLPVFGATPSTLPHGEPAVGPALGSAVALGSVGRKWADVANMLDGILRDVDPPGASTVAEELRDRHAVLFPLGIPPIQESKLAEGAVVGHDWTDERWMQHVWTLSMSVARCSREELEPVMDHMVGLMRKAGGKVAESTVKTDVMSLRMSQE